LPYLNWDQTPVSDRDSFLLRTGLRTKSRADERLQFRRQIGAKDVFLDYRDSRGDVFEDGGVTTTRLSLSTRMWFRRSPIWSRPGDVRKMPAC